ncbi:hypothetical protein [Streptomyces sp. NPDC002057]|uniref:hypothetical protein n=1 Tax=Streptomyces sp. NPDC002057 TaxID=3154664 RepID=UPI00332EA89F
MALTHLTPTTRTGLALGALAATLAALAVHTTTATTTASDRETGTVKWVTAAKSAGEKKVEVIK